MRDEPEEIDDTILTMRARFVFAADDDDPRMILAMATRRWYAATAFLLKLTDIKFVYPCTCILMCSMRY